MHSSQEALIWITIIATSPASAETASAIIYQSIQSAGIMSLDSALHFAYHMLEITS